MSCCRTALSPTATLITTTAGSKLHCDDRGCQVRSSLCRCSAPPAVGTSFIAVAVTATATETDEPSATALSALLDDDSASTMNLSRRRKRDLLLAEIAVWKAQVVAFFDQPSQAAPSSSPSDSSSPRSSKSKSNPTSASPTPSSANQTILSPPSSSLISNPSPNQSSSTASPFHIRVPKRRSTRKQIDELFVPIDNPIYSVPSSTLARTVAPSPATVPPSTQSSNMQSSSTAKQPSSSQNGTQSSAKNINSGASNGADKNRRDEDNNRHPESRPSIDDDSADSDSESELSDEEEAWNEGYKNWKACRRQWTSKPAGSETSTPSTDSSAVRNHPIHQLKPDSYPKIYRVLVHESRRLRVPINLSDATKILVSGWQSTGQWPPQPGKADPLIGRRKR
ncbi:hypothetical protein BZA70DRAFT_62865 [Myxozyma melibiosi]|uniref:Gag1-like clamp domain-containing protein n=1 Tax=Myxozyma melibiosi TaxID=54550 RepID=A0ABR1F1Z1_9ASCO